MIKPVKRLAFEAKKIFEHPQIRRNVILSGPRRVGKTTIIYQMIDEYLRKGIFMFPLIIPCSNYVTSERSLKCIKTTSILTNGICISFSTKFSMPATGLDSLESKKLAQLMGKLEPLQKHFHQYLLVGGFPEVALSNDVDYAQKMIREDVVDKVLKRDMASLFPIRNVAELEKIFLSCA